MANTLAAGSGPFEFTNSNGKHISIPISAFSFDASGNLVVDPAWTAVTKIQPASGLLAYALAEGLIAPAPAPSPFPALLIKAADRGTGGNNITVTISAVTPAADPTQSTFSITITENDVYPGLTAASITGILGSSSVSGSTLTSVVTGSSPGLVQVEDGTVYPNGAPVATTSSLVGDPALLDVDGDGSPPLVFTLLAKKGGADGALTQIDISLDTASPPIPGPETFTLTASWTKTVTASLADLQTVIQNQLGYEVVVSLPGSGAFSVPAAGVSTLSGGTTGSPSSATLFTGI
jgi:hypothetical protein